MKAGGKRPQRWPRLRWTEGVRNDMMVNQIDPNLAQNRDDDRPQNCNLFLPLFRAVAVFDYLI